MLVELVDANEEFENASKIVEPWRLVKNKNSKSFGLRLLTTVKPPFNYKLEGEIGSYNEGHLKL